MWAIRQFFYHGTKGKDSVWKSDGTEAGKLFRRCRECLTTLDIFGRVLRRVDTVMRVVHKVKPVDVRSLW